jgi:hypothetical protein
MTDQSRPACPDVARDLMTGWATAYASALNIGVTYWAETAAAASSYSADVVQALLLALRRPSDSRVILNDLAARLKDHLVQSGDLAERSLLEFNRRLETGLRGVPAATPDAGGGTADGVSAVWRSLADLGAKEARDVEASRATDVAAVTRELERLLEELKRLQRAGRSEPCAGGSPAFPTG